MKLMKLITKNEVNIIQIFFTKRIDQRTVECSGDFLHNAELDEVVVVVVELEARLFLRSPHLHPL